MIIETARLVIRLPDCSERDIQMYYDLWNSQEVMSLVGFPQGLLIQREEIRKKIFAAGDRIFNRTLVIELKKNFLPIGEAKMNLPDETNIARTDIKILPNYWNNGFGKEVKSALVDYIFENTTAIAVEATPNKKNLASQKIQKFVGASKVGESVYCFPDKMRSYTKDVEYCIFRLYRDVWQKRNKDNKND